MLKKFVNIGLMLFLVFFNSIHAEELPLQNIQLPPGFKISLYAKVPAARQLALGKNGVVFVGTKKEAVYALIPASNFSQAQKVIKITEDLNSPNGVAFYDHALYVAETDRILKFNHIIENLEKPLTPHPIATLPDKRWHGLRYMKFSPAGELYVAVGAPCNVCVSKDPNFATILKINKQNKIEIYAKGVRNTVGFDWSPLTQQLWFTENGRDYLGDNIPPDELNYAPKPNMDFGFPYFYGKNIPDPEYGKEKNPKEFTPSNLNLPAHAAALGMVFYQGKMFPASYHNRVFIAEHGSWNRSQKIGYRITEVTIKGHQALDYKVFAGGWLQDQKAWGRPVDLLMLPDGSLLVSDDEAGMIYRITYHIDETKNPINHE